MKKENKKEKGAVIAGLVSNRGITLVALVITIIVLIILAGVSINAVMNDGLITNAKEAKNEYEQGEREEKIEIGKLLQEVEQEAKGNWTQNLTEGTVTNGDLTLKVGDYVAYTPQAEVTTYDLPSKYSGYEDTTYKQRQKNVKWRVLGANENGKLELVSSGNLGTLSFRDYQAYNNGVYIMNEMANTLYGNGENGSTARSIKLEDLLKVTNFDYSEYTNGAGIKYGATKTYENIKVPAMLQLKQNQSEQDALIEQTEFTPINIEVTNTFWSKAASETDFVAPIYYELLMSGKTYSLATRCLSAEDERIVCGLYEVSSGHFMNDYQYTLPLQWYYSDIEYAEDDEWDPAGIYLLPIVTLGNSVKIENYSEGATDHTTTDTAWLIK